VNDTIRIAARTPAAPSQRGDAIAAALVAAWFAAMAATGARGDWGTWRGVGPLSAIQLAIVAPPIVFVVAVTVSSALRDWLRSLDLARLVQWQVLRVLGASHLVSWGLGRIGGGFALPVGIGNLAVSLLAAHATLLTARGDPRHRRWILVVSSAGLCEFAMTAALAIGGAFTRRLAFDPALSSDGYASIRTLPISLFPTFLIPFFTLLHLAALAKLRLERLSSTS